MKPALKAKWIRALRNGKYKQGHGRLRTQSGSMCCLGVLCDITEPIGWQRKGRAWRHGLNDFLPASMQRDRFGITGSQISHLSTLNDGDRTEGVKRHSFEQIAAWKMRNMLEFIERGEALTTSAGRTGHAHQVVGYAEGTAKSILTLFGEQP